MVPMRNPSPMNPPIRMLRLRGVMEKTGLSRSQIYRLVGLGTFPKQIQLSDRAAAWIEVEVDRWLQKRIDQARGLDAGKANAAPRAGSDSS